MTIQKSGEQESGFGRSGREIPDTSGWRPRDASETLAAIFAEECKAAEERLLACLRHEKRTIVDNFDSGLPFESMVRKELAALLPRRYSVASGYLLDREGRTSGHCDFLAFNEAWFSPVKSSQEQNRKFLPVEGVYAVGEVKQTLSSVTLDEALEKLVKCQRLNRPRTFAHRLVENRESCDCPHGLTNPLFSFVLAGGTAPGETLESLIERFFDISRSLKRLEVVRALCVLGEGTVVWSFRDPLDHNEIKPALFVEADLFHPIFPTYSAASHRSPLLLLIQVLLVSLFHVVLGPEDVAAAYSFDNKGISVPSRPEVALPVEQEWADLAGTPCRWPDRHSR